MYILVEGYHYPLGKIKHIVDGSILKLKEVTEQKTNETKETVGAVGYFYYSAKESSPYKKSDCVFILPKVFSDGEKRNARILKNKEGESVKPEEIITPEDQEKNLTPELREFIYKLAVHTYRAITVYRELFPDNTIVSEHLVQKMNNGQGIKARTFLDIMLALQEFNRKNQNFFFFILRNQHSGLNKINWTRTISHSRAIIQDDEPVYLNPINKKRQINFDEELLIIFFSILRYMHDHYGFPVIINVNFQLITGDHFKAYLDGVGMARLSQIKYKYFSDKAVFLWNLCYAFFDGHRQFDATVNEKEYLLATDFDKVFEGIIDELIGDKELPKGLKEQKDGKLVDHLYIYKDLITGKGIYYIADSKYYGNNKNLDEKSVYKQFTYARNVIQWNIDYHKKEHHEPLRDKITEGYNIIPNFFISAVQETSEIEDDTITVKENNKDNEEFPSCHFKNRLFDRDTLLAVRYYVSFLYVISLYGRNDSGEKYAWKLKAKEMFRKKTLEKLNEKYWFYILKPKDGTDAEKYISTHFKTLQGTIYAPNHDYTILILALEKLALENKKREENIKEDTLNEWLKDIKGLDIKLTFDIDYRYKLGDTRPEFKAANKGVTKRES